MPPTNEDYVLDLLRDVGLVSRQQVEEARTRRNGSGSVLDVLVKEGVVSGDDISRSLAAQAHMHWVDLSEMIVPQEVINEIKPADARRFRMLLEIDGLSLFSSGRMKCAPSVVELES